MCLRDTARRIVDIHSIPMHASKLVMSDAGINVCAHKIINFFLVRVWSVPLISSHKYT